MEASVKVHRVHLRREAVELRERIAEAGGLVCQADIGRRWRMSKARVCVLAGREDFPRPVATLGRTAVYVATEVDQWRTAFLHENAERVTAERKGRR